VRYTIQVAGRRLKIASLSGLFSLVFSAQNLCHIFTVAVLGNVLHVVTG
jgi:hypothetical protein